jgi:hypothetical protein
MRRQEGVGPDEKQNETVEEGTACCSNLPRIADSKEDSSYRERGSTFARTRIQTKSLNQPS